MDLQSYIKNSIAASRAKTLAESDQLTLGEMILKLEPIVEKQKDREDEATVCFDFASTYPTGLSSWRGIYAELAIEWAGGDYSHEYKEMKVSDFLKLLKSAIGKTYEGWKGGDFVMNKNTPMWVSNRGMVGHTAVIDIVDDDYQVIIITAYRES